MIRHRERHVNKFSLRFNACPKVVVYFYSMESLSGDSLLGAYGETEIFLDGIPVELPSGCRLLSTVRAYLETLALQNQSVLCALTVDGLALNLGMPLPNLDKFSRVEAESVGLEDSECLLLKIALQQIEHVRESVETTMTLVLINNGNVARELWWNLALQLKGPIMTLGLLPEPATGGASFKKIRKWQLEQMAGIIREVGRACRTGDTLFISDVLEKRVLPWLARLENLISLCHETNLAAERLGIRGEAF